MNISVSELVEFHHSRHCSAGVGSTFGGAAHRELSGDGRRLSVCLSVDGIKVKVSGIADAVSTCPLTVTELKIVNELQEERRAFAVDQAAMYAYMLAVEEGAAEVGARVHLMTVDGYTLLDETHVFTSEELAAKFRALLLPYVRWVRQVWAKHPQEAPLGSGKAQGLQVPKLGIEKAETAYRLGMLAQGGKVTLSDIAESLNSTRPAVRRLLARAGMEIDRNGKTRAPGFLVFSKPSFPEAKREQGQAVGDAGFVESKGFESSVKRPKTVQSGALVYINTSHEPTERYKELSEWVATVYPESEFWKWTGPARAEYASWLEAHLSPDECGLFRWAIENYLYTNPGEYLKNPFKFVAVQDGHFIRRSWRTYAERPEDFQARHDRAVEDRDKERELGLKKIAYSVQMKQVAFQLGKGKAKAFKAGGALFPKPGPVPKQERPVHAGLNPLIDMTDDPTVIGLWEKEPPGDFEALELLAHRICDLTPDGHEWWDVTSDDRFVDLVILLMEKTGLVGGGVGNAF